MTKSELQEISRERKFISKRLDILDPDNPIENQERERLFNRLDTLEQKLDQSIAESERKKDYLTIVT